MDEPSADSDRTKGPDEVFCRHCGEVISQHAEICPHCGVRQRDPPGSSLDGLIDELTEGGNPFVAALASAVLPGLGQLYNRELTKGLVLFAAAIFAAFSVAFVIGFLLYPAVWIYAIYDAYKVAERQSAREGPAAAPAPDDSVASASVDSATRGSQDPVDRDSDDSVASASDEPTDDADDRR